MKLREIQESMSNVNDFVNEISISVISNVTFEPYFNSLMQSRFANIGISANILPISYEEYQLVENKEKICKANYIAVCLNFDCLYQNAITDIGVSMSYSDVFDDLKNRCCKLYEYIKQQTQSPILWFGFEDYCYQYNFVNGRIIFNENIVDRINNEICILLENKDMHIDLKRIIADVGIKNAYNNKGNIIVISESLNIGLDSMVFIDDSDFEIQSVKSIMPELIAIKYNRDTIYGQLSCFNLSSKVDLNKVKQRNDTYKTNEQRRQLKSNCYTFDEYVNSLEMNIDIHKALPIELNRIAEITQRTNKCTNGKRYTVDRLKETMLKKNYFLFSVSVSDKFSNLGLVGAIGMEDTKLDLFSLSCRALGRNVEAQMIFEVRKHLITSFSFLSTGKNEKVKEMVLQAINNPENNFIPNQVNEGSWH